MARSIGMLLETAPDFGYDSKQVIKWLAAFGIPKTTARDNTKELREEIDAARNTEVLRLSAEGLGKKAIAKEVGCSPNTAQKIIDEHGGQNERAAQNDPSEVTPIASPEAADSSSEDDADDLPWSGFDEDELDTTPALNPADKAPALGAADAFQKALDEHEEERQESTRQQDKSVCTRAAGRLLVWAKPAFL